MKDREQILVYTQIAFLNALALSFLGLQFILPFTFLLLVWVMPVIFALEILYIPVRIALPAGVIFLGLAAVLFGVDIGAWAAAYFFMGFTLGTVWRKRLPAIIRVLVTGLAVALALTILMAAFAWLAHLSWQEITDFLAQLGMFQLSIMRLLLLGGTASALILSLVVNGLFARILRHLQTEGN